MLEPHIQRIPKPLKGCIAFGMGWWKEVEKLPVEGDGVIYIIPILRFVVTDADGGRFAPERVQLPPGLE